MRRFILLCVSVFAFIIYCWCPMASADPSLRVPVLVYHNMDPTKKGSMTISTARFEEQMQWIKNNGYTVIPLMQLVSYLQGKINTLPPKSVVITDDDGRNSVYKYMLPIVRKFNIPVTLFIFPQVISHAPYALTWQELKELQNTGLFDIQGHTYWHPNFKQDRKHMTEKQYEKMVYIQLVKSKQVIDAKLNTHITLLAWPFGIYNDYVEQEAKKAGYVMAFSIGARCTSRDKNAMAQPRYMIVADQSMQHFAAIVKGRA